MVALARTIHPARRAKERLFVVLALNELYADVSGSKDSTFVVAGAYVAGQPHWRKFRRAWSAILDDADVREFHATDFFQYHGEFVSWKGDAERQNAFAERFTGAATRHTALGLAFGLDRSAYNDVLEETMRGLHRPDARVSAESYAIASCLSHVDRVAKRHGLNSQFAVILENGGGSGDAVALLNKLQESGESWARRYVSFTTMPKSERALQAADLLAYECWKHITRTENPDGRAVRKSLLALTRKQNIESVYATREDLVQSLPHIVRAVSARRSAK
jgi:hypothetical protein